MAAAVLESVAVPRASASFHKAPVASPLPRVAVAAVGHLRECRGLRIVGRTARSSSGLAIGRKAIRRRVACEAQNTAVGNVPDVTMETWQSLVLDSEVPVLVEFWAPWCGPCRMLLPTIEELSKEYVGKLKCLKINTDDCPEIANQFGIRSIPTIILFKNGEKKDAVIGAVPKTTLVACLDKFL